jgi:hypothetical protein
MTEHSMTPEAATKLRKPFPKESIGQLPKGGQLLDFVGHAATTDRLLTVDPTWTWRPFSLEEMQALPPKLRDAGLWIHLTVCGITRPGFGDGPDPKQCIGDAIRNAAMRFGVALDLWAKESLVEFAQAHRPEPQRTDPPPLPPDATVAYLDTSSKLAKAMFASINEAKIEDPKAFMSEVVGRTIVSSKELTQDEARMVLDHLPTKAAAS